MEHLPVEAISNIILHLSYNDINLLLLVSTWNKFNDIINNDYFWKEKLLIDYNYNTNNNYKYIYLFLYTPVVNMNNLWTNGDFDYEKLWTVKINNALHTTFNFTYNDLLHHKKIDLTQYVRGYSLSDFNDWIDLAMYLHDYTGGNIDYIMKQCKKHSTYKNVPCAFVVVNVKNHDKSKYLNVALPNIKGVDETLVFNFDTHTITYIVKNYKDYIINLTLNEQIDVLYKLLFYYHEVEFFDNYGNDIFLPNLEDGSSGNHEIFARFI